MTSYWCEYGDHVACQRDGVCDCECHDEAHHQRDGDIRMIWCWHDGVRWRYSNTQDSPDAKRVRARVLIEFDGILYKVEVLR